MNLNEICEVYSGYAFKEFHENPTGNPVIKIGNITNSGSIDTINCSYTNEIVSDRYLSRDGDIYIALSGATTGKIGLMKKNNFCINQRVGIVRLLNKNIPINYLCYFLQSKTKKILSDAAGAAQPNISPKDISRYQFPERKNEEMTIISNELLAIESAIRIKKTELNNLNELIKSQFIEMFKDYDSYKNIGELSNICRGASPRPISNFITKGDGENWIKIGDVGENDIYITKTAEKVTKAGADKSRRVKPGDFILSNSMSFGRPYILGINGCVHDGWLIIADYQEHFEPLFFYHLLRSDYVQSQFDGSANGACVRNLNSDLVKKVKVITPPIAIQRKFVEFAKQIDKSKFIVQKQIDDLQELLDSKMQEYFGEEE